jgi:hypothetical protein
MNEHRRHLILAMASNLGFLGLILLVNATFGMTRILGEEDDSPRRQSKIGSAEILLSGNYRLRGEIQRRYNIRDFGTGKTEAFLLSRLRFHTNIQFTRQLRLHFQLQDAQVLGSSFSDADFATGNNPFHDLLDINQAFIEGRPFQPIRLKLGRQPISFRDRWIFGPGDWGNTGRYVWDAAMLTVTSRYVESRSIIGRLVPHNPDLWPNRRALGSTAYASYNSIKTLPFLLDVFYVFKHDNRGLTRGERHAGNLASHSFGLWLKGEIKSFEYGATLVGQAGRWASDEIRACGLVVAAGYQWNTCWQPLTKIQYIVGSGDNDPNDGVHGTYDGVFGGADTDLYGWMNLFFWQNLREYRFDFKLTPSNRLNFKTEYHYFMLDAPRDAWYSPGKSVRRDQTGQSGRGLGHEIDVIASIAVWDYWEMQFGYCLFLPAEFVKQTGMSRSAQWCFLETTLSF